MTKEMYDVLSNLIDGHYIGDDIPCQLIEVAEKTISEPDSNIRAIKYTLEAWVFKCHLIVLLVVGQDWSDRNLKVYGIEYDLNKIDEDKDEDNKKRYSLVSDIVNYSAD